jgi:O-antigen ligase
MLGVFFSHGVTTELLALMLPLQLAVYLTTKRRLLAVVAVIAAGAAAIALLLTLRRGALLGTAVAILLIVVAMARGWLRIADRWRLILAGGAILVLLVGVFTFKRQEILSRLRSAVRIETSRSATVTDLGLTSRLSMWLTAWEMGKRHPVLGVGNGGFPSQYGEYRRYFVQNPSFARVAEASEAEDFDEVRAPHAHNEYLQIFDELGLLGLLLFAAFWVRVIWILFRARRSTESAFVIGALAGLLAFAVSSAMSAFSFRYSPGTIMSACVAGLGCALALATRAAYAELLQKQGKTDAAAAERAMLDRLDTRAGRSWQIALRAKDAPATMEARAQGLIPPNELEPRLVRVLVQARAYHYLK